MKIYFGRVPEKHIINIDEFFTDVLRNSNYSFQEAVNNLFGIYDRYEHKDVCNFYTCNPMVLQYLDEEHVKLVYFVDNEGKEIQFINDPICQEKYEWMDVGEALIDDSRVLN